jgi:uncharacterized protein YtpQ (UPF0354 family)
VLLVAAVEFPERHFSATSDPQVLKLGESEIGLQSLYAKYNQTNRSQRALAELVKENVGAGLAAIDAAESIRKLDWPAAKALLRPQVVPIEYLARMPIVHRPLAKDAAQGFVLDQEKTYQYVLVDDLERWHVSVDELQKAAADNLSRASKSIEIESGSGPDKFLAVETKDGYDAARLLVPEFREFVTKHLGDTFYAAMPNRDFLIMWSSSCSSGFQERTRRTVAEDFNSQPYPLSKSVFRVTAAAVTELPQ